MKIFLFLSSVLAQYEILGGQQFWKNLENEIKEGLNESMEFQTNIIIVKTITISKIIFFMPHF